MARLGDICKIKSGYAFKSESFSNVGVPVVRIGNITSDGINVDYSICYDTAFWNDNSNYRVEKNDILVAMSGATVGKACINTLNIPLLLNQRVASIVCDNPITQKYVYHAINSDEFLKYVIDNSAGCAQPNISAKQLANFQLKVSDLKIQERIVTVLDGLSHIIYLRKQQLSKLDELVKSRFIELFGDCKNEVLIGDVISISRGASPRPISDFITDSVDGVNWIKIGDVSENSLYITETAERITPEGAKKSRMVHKGDFILSNSMSFGRPYILGINGCVHDGWLIMSDFKETFNELYLYYAIRSDDVQYQFSGKVNGATVKNLNSDLVKNTFIKVPPMELQNKFAAFVEQTDKSKLAIQKSLEKLETIKKALMQKYFG